MSSHYEKLDGIERCIEDEIPFEIPDSWEWVRLGTLFQHNTGKALNSSNSTGKKLTYITTSNLYWDRFELEKLKEMPFTENEIEKCTVTRGDLLVCEGGDIGRAAIWKYDYPIRIQNHIHRLRPYTNISILLHLLSLQEYWAYWRKRDRNTGTIIKCDSSTVISFTTITRAKQNSCRNRKYNPIL